MKEQDFSFVAYERNRSGQNSILEHLRASAIGALECLAKPNSEEDPFYDRFLEVKGSAGGPVYVLTTFGGPHIEAILSDTGGARVFAYWGGDSVILDAAPCEAFREAYEMLTV